MFVEFDKIASHSRIWIYQTDRNLTQNENNIVSYHIKNGISDWQSHGNNQKASFKIEMNRFIIIALDESVAPSSGCSIDTSTGWLKFLGKELTINFFDRDLAYLEENEIKTVPILQVKKAIKNEVIKENTIIFNNNLQIKSELMSFWKIEAQKYSYLTNFFNNTVS